jgi:hypothetical protein
MIRAFSGHTILLKILCAVALVFSGWRASAGCVAIAAENPRTPSEEQVKAAFLFNFIKFVDWPNGVFAGKNSPFVIGVIGDGPFGKEIRESLQGKTISGRELQIRKITRPGEIRGMHALLVCASEVGIMPEVLASVKGTPVLTIGEMDQFGQQGGIINFYLQDNKVRFEINLDAADKARLKISSQLLSLARIIKDNAPAGRM